MGVVVEEAAGEFFAGAAPLFEEEGEVLLVALVAEAADPIGLHGAGAGAAFAANNHPVDAL